MRKPKLSELEQPFLKLEREFYDLVPLRPQSWSLVALWSSFFSNFMVKLQLDQWFIAWTSSRISIDVLLDRIRCEFKINILFQEIYVQYPYLTNVLFATEVDFGLETLHKITKKYIFFVHLNFSTWQQRSVISHRCRWSCSVNFYIVFKLTSQKLNNPNWKMWFHYIVVSSVQKWSQVQKFTSRMSNWIHIWGQTFNCLTLDFRWERVSNCLKLFFGSHFNLCR